MTEEHTPDRRKHGYKEIEEKLDNHIRDNEERQRKFFFKALAAFAVIGITSAVALAGFAIVLKQIQQQRYDNTLSSCLDQNERYANVISEIDKAVKQVPESRRKRAKESAKPFKLIITAAVPYRDDCEGYAQSRVKGHK